MKALRWLLSLAVLGTSCAHAVDNWPQVALPDNAERFEMGGATNINGIPMQVQGFLLRQKPAEAAAWFRNNMGKPLVENRVAGKLVLGRMQGAFYITVQLQEVGQGTRGLLAITHRKAAYAQQASFQADAAHTLVRFPADTRLVSHITTQEADRLITYTVASNQYGEALNHQHLVSVLAGEGMRLEREGRPDEQSKLPLPQGAVNGRLLFFRGAGHDAVAVICRSKDGSTLIVLQTMARIENYQ